LDVGHLNITLARYLVEDTAAIILSGNTLQLLNHK
jgi:hypothetical protein